MSDGPTEDLPPHHRRRPRWTDTSALVRDGGVMLPKRWDLKVLFAIFCGIATGTGWALTVNARVASLERTTDPENKDGLVARNQARIERAEARIEGTEAKLGTVQSEAKATSERLILVLCSLCRGLPRADCAEACRPSGGK